MGEMQTNETVDGVIAVSTEADSPVCQERRFTYEEVSKAITANRANTLALLDCLREAIDAKPFREAEEAVAGSRSMGLSMQTPHALFAILIAHGAIEKIDIPEEGKGEQAPEGVALEDQPVDYLVRTTDLGLRVLKEFDPLRRFSLLMAGEPENYRSAYAVVLDLCEDGASRDDVEQALSGHEALFNPKQIYPGYFISKLETVDGISWSGVWKTTDEGRRMRALLA